MAPVILIVLAFLLGGIPFGLVIGRLAGGIDVRKHGSGNLGATNVLRQLGVAWGVLVLLLDIGKGWLATALLATWLGLGSASSGSPWPLLAGVAAVCGHVFSPYVRFRGGKGVATALGGFLGLDPLAALVAVAGFFGALLIWRYVSLGSMVMVGLFPVAVMVRHMADPRWPMVVTGVLVASLVAWCHRANWRRLARGTEPKVGRRR